MQSAGPRATAWLTACCSKLFNLTMVKGIHGCVVDVSSGCLMSNILFYFDDGILHLSSYLCLTGYRTIN